MAKLVCPVCGKEFKVMPSQAKRRVTCSRECRDALMRERIASGEIAVGRNAWSEETKAEMAASAEMRANMVMLRKMNAGVSASKRAERESKKQREREAAAANEARIMQRLVELGEGLEGETLGEFFKRVDFFSFPVRQRFDGYTRRGLWKLSESGRLLE